MTTRKKRTVFAGITVLGILLDQLTKYLAVVFLKTKDTFPLWQNVLHLTYVENRGAAFGMLANNRWVFMSISVIAILAIAGFVLWKPQRLSVPETVGLGMMVSGGIGNMIDRVFLGYVVDFIDVRLIRFAVFNGADSFVCVGAGMLILGLALEIKEENKKR